MSRQLFRHSIMNLFLSNRHKTSLDYLSTPSSSAMGLILNPMSPAPAQAAGTSLSLDTRLSRATTTSTARLRLDSARSEMFFRLVKLS